MAGPTSLEAETPFEERALAFRATFGLDTDLTLIRLAERSSEYSRDPYGVPLSTAERDELLRRSAVEDASIAAAEFGAKQPTWGGYYFDQLDRGAPVFLFTADLTPLRSVIADLLPPGTGFRVEHASRPLSQLIATKEAIVGSFAELRSSGVDIISAGLDIAGNQVVVGVRGLNPETEASLHERFGSFLRFKEDAPAFSDAVDCPRQGCRPIRGGIRINGTNLEPQYFCTAGFNVRRTLNDSLAVLTAGHCLWSQVPTSQDPYGERWYHKTSSGSITDYFGYSRWDAFWNMSNGDVGLIEIDSNETAYNTTTYPANRIYTNLGNRLVVGYTQSVNQTQGSQVCAYGSRSDDALCSTITDPDQTKESELISPWTGNNVSFLIQHTKVYGLDLMGGDSGGPIWKPQPGGTAQMFGTHVHSERPNNTSIVQDPDGGWYTPLTHGRVAYQEASGWTDDFVVCTTQHC